MYEKSYHSLASTGEMKISTAFSIYSTIVTSTKHSQGRIQDL